MKITPSGTKKQMVAQFFGNETAPDNNTGILEAPQYDVGLPAEQSSLDQNAVQPPETPQPPQQEEDGSSDITSYVFKKLESFGYPPRRLEEFEKEFYSEKVYPGGVREVTIIIPDRYYGTRKSISSKDFTNIIKEVQETFGLSFIEGLRKDKRIEMDFTSQRPQQDESDAEVVDDDLEEVYGKGKGSPDSRKKRKPKREQLAVSRKDLIKKSLDGLFEMILKKGLDKENDTKSV